jgi:argininosuccinate synthase
MAKEKILLAYSGGLDTSIIIPGCSKTMIVKLSQWLAKSVSTSIMKP